MSGRYTAYVDGRACHNCGLEPYQHECPRPATPEPPLAIYCPVACDACRDRARELGVALVVSLPPRRQERVR